MINLLPAERKKDIRAGRANTLLVRYNFLIAGAAVFAIAAGAFVYVYLASVKATAETTISANDKSLALYSTSATEAKAFRSNLLIAKQILNQQVVYSDIVLKIAGIVPKNVVLTSLSLDAKTFGTSSTFQAEAKSTDDVIKLKNAFTTSSLFKDVYFQSITFNDGAADGYPYAITFSATINKTVALK